MLPIVQFPQSASRRHNGIASLMLASSVLVLSACAGSAPERKSADAATPAAVAPAAVSVDNDAVRSRLIAADFVEAMTQIPTIAPSATSLRVRTPKTRFGELLMAGLQQAGYDLRLVLEPGPGVLDYYVAAAAAQGDTYTFMVTAETVKLKRDFRVGNRGVRPVSAMFVHGASASGIALDESRFGVSGQRAAVRPRPAAPVRADAAVTTAIPPRQIVQRTPLVTPAPVVESAREPNLYETRRSKHEGVLAAYDTIERHIMVFANDSMIMGPQNKRLARSIIADFDSRRDVLSIIGCSHGKTQLRNGNERLATGRAARVKEEFVRAGIESDLVLAEGCWAGQHFDPMPARGVLVTHQRRVNG